MDSKDQLKNNDDSQDSLNNMDILQLSNKKRSKLHTQEVVNWFRSRRQNFTKKFYLYFPEELLKNIEIRKIFKSFDTDNSSKKTKKIMNNRKK